VSSKTISENEAYVWLWLPEDVEPVVAGRISRSADQYLFNYGQSYLSLEKAIPLNPYELPLQSGFIAPLPGLTLAGCLRDGSPDAWGRRTIINRLANASEHDNQGDETNELLFMLYSGSNRTGSLDFQTSATGYSPRETEGATLVELLRSAERVEKGVPLTPALDKALMHGTSIGGARAKAHIIDNDKQYVAKFSSTSDTRDVVKGEYIAMRLAANVGLDVAPVKFLRVAEKDVLLVERFDRTFSPDGWQRKCVLSALTLFELDEMMGRYASYAEFSELIRLRFTKPKDTQAELYARMVFNILVGNTDDHARNHAAFWDGKALSLTPAYDICPQNRTGGEASQAMTIAGDKNLSRLDFCVENSAYFGLNSSAANAIIKHQIQTIEGCWESVCDEVNLNDTERRLLRGRQIFNSASVEGFEHLIAS